MDRERWQRIEALYNAALEQTPSGRAAFLAQADPELRAEVESLVAHNAGLTQPVWDNATKTSTQVSAGTQLGPYRIEGPLGAGGMGQVFRATDTRLGRLVAIKTSQEQFSERFHREARAISSLNHPHICALYDVGPSYIVMELCEGETLAARLKRGKLSPEDAIRYGAQIADALAAAHAKGIVHRDLKPPNIMLTKSGVKVLDFGIAKSTGDETITGTHLVVGTPAYMAPEQREGRLCDARTDVYSLGLVLCEMATGKRVETGQPPTLDSLTPAFAHVIERCLEKDPDDRWQAASDIRKELEWSTRTRLATAETPAKATSARAWMAAALLGAIATLTLGFLYFRETATAVETSRLSIALPVGSQLHSFDISPDGRTVAIAASIGGRTQLLLRPMDAAQAQPVAFTEGAIFPFWSPDSRYVGFFAQGKLKKIAASGGSPQTLCDAPVGRSGSWTSGDVIFFRRGDGGLLRVSAAGGTPVAATTLGNSGGVAFLPDGRNFVYWNRTGKEPGIYVGSLDGSQRRILEDKSAVAFSPSPGRGLPSHLLFVRAGALMAVPFDESKAQATGEAFPVADGVSLTQIGTYLPAAASTNGTLLYAAGDSAGGLDQFAWVDRSGTRLGTVGEPGQVMDPALSPDEKSLLFRRASGQDVDLWMRDLARGTERRFTNTPVVDAGPVWSPKGDRVAFMSVRGGLSEIFEKAASSSANDERRLFETTQNVFAQDWSRDGRFLVYTMGIGLARDIWFLDFGASPPVRKPFTQSQFDEVQAQLSPDNRWMAFASDRSGRREVYVRPFPQGEGEYLLSTAGGEMPRWRGDGKELFFEAAGGKMMAVAVKANQGSFETDAPVPLFDANLQHTTAPVIEYNVTSDGKRFLINTSATSAGFTPLLTVVTNWMIGR